MNNKDRSALLGQIGEISFAVYDTLLFLDTHPDDQQALEFYREMNRKRHAAVEEYSRMFGPLTADSPDAADGSRWKWIDQPWPWEGGAC